ncbi:carboxypeptidase-like regulatory domain-containing protein [Natronoflexus pectinivorans]|nr:carboxypeptidase-like regulatory domain-containing protein [Natronoflexus pectinivorans]
MKIESTHNWYVIIFLTMIIFSGCEERLETPLTGKLKGYVIDNVNFDPIPDVRVTTHPYSESVRTDETGMFYIENIHEGEYNVIAGKSGFKSQSVTISVLHNQTTDVEIMIEKNLTAEHAPAFTSKHWPLNNSNQNSTKITISWQAENTDSTFYDLLVYESGHFGNPMIYTNLEDTFYHINNLKFETWYYWQVQAYNEAGRVFSEIRQFKTQSFPKNQILFSRVENELSQLFVTDTLGANIIQITNSKHHIWNAKINNQRTRIAFESTQNIAPQLYTMNLDGSDVKRLTTVPIGSYFHQKIEYDWAPNGSHLVFTSFDKLYRINPDGTGMQVLAVAPEGSHFREVIYKPDGSGLFVMIIGNTIKNRQIYSFNANGSNMQQVYKNSDYAIQGLAVHPDNVHILFSMDMSGTDSPVGRMLDAKIYRMNTNSGQLTNLSQGKSSGTNDLNAMYSPNGGHIVFTNRSNSTTAIGSIKMMNPDGSRRKKFIGDADYPYWFD